MALATLRSIDRQLHDGAQTLPQSAADLVRSSLDQDPFGGGILRRLRNQYHDCATRLAHTEIRTASGAVPKIGDDPIEKVDALLEKKVSVLARTRRHLQLKAMLEVWLYVHVPMTFALIAALAAHIISVFFYW